MKERGELALLLEVLDQAYDTKAWHGPNMRGSIRRLSAQQAAWRPSPRRHNIWELVVHAAYWKYTVRRRLLGEKRGSFPFKGSNWFVRPVERSEVAWQADRALLDEMHRTMREAIAALPERKLNTRIAGSIFLNKAWIYGIASHDLYHAGQIQLLKRMMAGKV
jgi:hypothetical protein